MRITNKEKILKIVHTSKIKIDFISGRKIIISNTNVALEDPNRIIFSNNEKYLEVLMYQDCNEFYVKDFYEPLSLNRLIKIVNKYL